MHEADYDGLRFDAQRLTARRREGGLIRFTRRERALLLRFHQAPQRLLTRGQLLEALEVAGETSERNIDYLVNRLRAKLGDDARHPRYIRTRYGEGYVWIAPGEGECLDDAFIAIGPAAAHPEGSAARAFLQALRDHLAARIPIRVVSPCSNRPRHGSPTAASPTWWKPACTSTRVGCAGSSPCATARA